MKMKSKFFGINAKIALAALAVVECLQAAMRKRT